MREQDVSIYPSFKIWMNAKAVTPKFSFPTVITEISADKIHIRSARAIIPKTEIAISLQLNNEIVLRGDVIWVMELYDDDGNQFYQTGIKTDSILHRNIKAVGLAEKSKLLQEILYHIIERSNN